MRKFKLKLKSIFIYANDGQMDKADFTIYANIQIERFYNTVLNLITALVFYPFMPNGISR